MSESNRAVFISGLILLALVAAFFVEKEKRLESPPQPGKAHSPSLEKVKNGFRTDTLSTRAPAKAIDTARSHTISESTRRVESALRINLVGDPGVVSGVSVFEADRLVYEQIQPSTNTVLVERLDEGSYRVVVECYDGQRLQKDRVNVVISVVNQVTIDLPDLAIRLPLTIDVQWPHNWNLLDDGFLPGIYSLTLKPLHQLKGVVGEKVEPIELVAGVAGVHTWNIPELNVGDYLLSINGLDCKFKITSDAFYSGYYLARVEAPIIQVVTFELMGQLGSKVTPESIKYWQGRNGSYCGPNKLGEFEIIAPVGSELTIKPGGCFFTIPQGEFTAKVTGLGKWVVPVTRNCGVRLEGGKVLEFLESGIFDGPGENVSRYYSREKGTFVVLSEPGSYRLLVDQKVILSVVVSAGEFSNVLIEHL